MPLFSQESPRGVSTWPVKESARPKKQEHGAEAPAQAKAKRQKNTADSGNYHSSMMRVEYRERGRTLFCEKVLSISQATVLKWSKPLVARAADCIHQWLYKTGAPSSPLLPLPRPRAAGNGTRFPTASWASSLPALPTQSARWTAQPPGLLSFLSLPPGSPWNLK